MAIALDPRTNYQEGVIRCITSREGDLTVSGYVDQIHLGHAVGKNLDSLEMTIPALRADMIGGAKELSVAPINEQGFRYNLVESSKKVKMFREYIASIEF